MKTLITTLASWAAMALLQVAAAQTPAPTETSDPDGWQDFDGVALIINGDIITLRELSELIGQARAGVASTTPEETREIMAIVAEQAVSRRLMTQAGTELGIPVDGVDKTIEGYLNRERHGKSAQETEEWLKEQGVADMGAMRLDVRQELYRSFWLQGQRGYPVAGGRPWRDRYVRPGLLKEAYAFNPAIFGNPDTFKLQFLVLHPNAWGDLETALEALEGFRASIAEGADMGALVDEFGSILRDARGITEWIPLSSLQDPAVKEFCKTATEGSLSEVMSFMGKDGETVGCQVVRVVSRIEGQPAPLFSDPTLQVRLAELVLRGWDESRVASGSDQLWRTAYFRDNVNLRLSPPWVRRNQR